MDINYATTIAKALKDYNGQKNSCLKGEGRADRNGNKIEFRISFKEWWDIWQQSGKWEQRGRHKGEYVMARHDDVGHYEVGNVSIILASENVRQARLGVPISAGHKEAISSKMTGREFSEEHRRNLAASKVGIPRSDETKATISAALKGKGWSEARRAAQQKPTFTDASRAAISSTHKGRPKSEEQKAKQSATVRRKLAAQGKAVKPKSTYSEAAHRLMVIDVFTSTLPRKELAAKHGISLPTISFIKNGKSNQEVLIAAGLVAGAKPFSLNSRRQRQGKR